MNQLPLNRCARALPALAGGVLIALAAAEPAIGGPSQLIQHLRAGESQIVVAYGTSLTASDWPAQLHAWLDTQFPGQSQVVNRGRPFMASQNERPIFDALVQLDAMVLSQTPDTVFLEFAMNDALEEFHITPQQLHDNLNTMIDRILADDPNREIILMTMNPAWTPPDDLSGQSYRANLADYYQANRDVAAERGLLVIDHHRNWIELRDTNPTLFKQYIPDGTHPSTEALMQVVTPEIIRALTIPEPATVNLIFTSVLAAGTIRRARRSLLRKHHAISS
jgi:lysophospholipase L1-like esterase